LFQQIKSLKAFFYFNFDFLNFIPQMRFKIKAIFPSKVCQRVLQVQVTLSKRKKSLRTVFFEMKSNMKYELIRAMMIEDKIREDFIM
jgi:hypothetical protein